MRYLLIMIAFVVASCQPAKEEGHAHDAAGGHLGESQETPRLDATVWTENTELFVEFPALIVGKTSKFAAHFTVLDKHQPVREGSVIVSLIKGSKGLRTSADAPSSPGIFNPSIKPTTAGIYQLIFEITTPNFTDKIIVKDVRVFANIDEAISTIGHEGDDDSISFLKEQAWKMPFQTAMATEREIYALIKTAGVWSSARSDVAAISATANGSILFKNGNLTVGSKVRKGQVLLRINSNKLSKNNLSTEIQQAKIHLAQTTLDYNRKKELYASKIISKASFDNVEGAYLLASANYNSLSAGYTTTGKKIVAPFNGYIQHIAVQNGAFVDQGATLLSIVKESSSMLEINVPAIYAEQLEAIHDVWYQARTGVWSNLKASNGTISAISRSVSASQPQLKIFAKVTEAVRMPKGSFTPVQIAIGNSTKAIVVPVDSLLEDYGSFTVIVQLTGESFERRLVTVGKRNGSHVEITSGLAQGEVVVTTGAYQVKMASMSGVAPAHGHAH
ncbi:MAG: efflux RND transporter periplasmic adaptor subunit [Flavobacteriaceae bacterium]|nr:efflux RND transporter periplasmic adaptor subunit [Flavobacteriaceae bacterium]